MSRRQREGRGGRDFHGCGNAGCFYCGNRRQFDGATRRELAEDDAEEWLRAPLTAEELASVEKAKRAEVDAF